MFIRVKLLNGLPELLWYTVPEHYNKSLTGLIVQVPVRNRILPALVIDEYKNKPSHLTFKFKDIHAIEQLPEDVHYFTFLKKMAEYYHLDSLYFIKRIHQFLIDKKEDSILVQEEQKNDIHNAVKLTDEQQAICNFITPHIGKKYIPTVLHGVTGSGKTEVYKHLFLAALRQNKSSILLLPEVTLAIAFENRLKEELPQAPIYGFHSGKSAKEKKTIWSHLQQKTPLILIGVHLPVLLPISNLGIIIVDEEHETGYQEKKHPKINSKEASTIRAQCANVPILFGSATPSLQTLYNVKTKNWSFFQLKERFSGILPEVKIVSLIENKNRKQFWISKELEAAIKDRLEKSEQTIIFINRRGMNFFVQCKECTFIFSCADCSVSLTLHENDMLVCHYCNTSCILPQHCLQCKTNTSNFLKKGIGTQKVVTILEKMFPQAIIARADLDTTSKKNVWQKTIAAMMAGKINILVGTQTITKGFHFPQVTLVGVLWADLQLGFPMYNAAETALQQLIQVSGRAGRNHTPGTVIIQTISEYPLLIHFLNEIDYLRFYAEEMTIRMELQYPPAWRLAELEIKHSSEKTLEQEAEYLIDALYYYAQKLSAHVKILGPAKPPVSKIKSIHSRKIYLKSKDFSLIAQLYSSIDKKKYSSSIYFTPNPL